MRAHKLIAYVCFCAALLFPSGAYAAPVDGLVGHFTFGDVGATAVSIVPPYAVGQVVGQGYSQGSSVSGGASLILDGTTYINLGRDQLPTIGPGISFSIFAWFRTDLPLQYHVLFGQGADTSSERTFMLYHWSNGGVAAFCGGQRILADSATTQWRHVGMVHDGVTGVFQLFVNGTLVGSSTCGVGTADVDVLIGARSSSTNGGARFHADGELDDIRVYNRTLSAAEVADVYTYYAASPTASPTPSGTPSRTASPEPTLNESGLEVFYAFEQGDGNATGSTIRNRGAAGSGSDGLVEGNLDLIPHQQRSALKFDGSTFVSVGDSASAVSFDPQNDAYTMSMWFQASTVGQFHALAVKGVAGSTRQYALYIWVDNTVVAYAGGAQLKTSVSIVSDEWNLYTLSSSPGSSPLATLFFNSDEIGTIIPGTAVNNVDLLIGARRTSLSNTGSIYHADGYTDEFRLFSRSVAHAELPAILYIDANITVALPSATPSPSPSFVPRASPTPVFLATFEDAAAVNVSDPRPGGSDAVGVMEGGVSFGAGLSGGGICFDGNTGSVRFGEHAHVCPHPASEYSMFICLKSDRNSAYQSAFTHGTVGDFRQLSIFKFNNDRLTVYVGGSRFGNDLPANDISNTQSWYCVMVTNAFNTARGVYEASVYLNGALLGTFDSGTGMSAVDAVLGARSEDNNADERSNFDGCIDNLFFYDVALTPEEITAVFSENVPSPSSTPSASGSPSPSITGQSTSSRTASATYTPSATHTPSATATSTPSASGAPVGTVLPQSLLLYASMDNTSTNGSLPVVSNTGITELGSSIGSVSIGVESGIMGTSLCLDGADSFVRIGRPSFLLLEPMTHAYTISLWFETNRTDDYQALISLGTSGHDRQFALFVFANNLLTAYAGGDRFGDAAQNNPQILPNVWHHAVVTNYFDNTSSSWMFSLYLNGTLIGSELSGDAVSAVDILIGARSTATVSEVRSPFSGCIDELRIYDRALSDDEIMRLHYEHTLATPSPTPSGSPSPSGTPSPSASYTASPTASQTPSPTIDPSLLLWLDVRDSGGSALLTNDGYDSNITLTPSGNVYGVDNGVAGAAVCFAGESYVRLGRPSSLLFDPQADEFTVSLWMKSSVNSEYQALFGLGTWGNDRQWYLWKFNTNEAVGYVGGERFGEGAPAAQVGDLQSWYHLLLVNRQNQSGVFEGILYVDGAEVTSYPSGSAVTTVDVLLGARSEPDNLSTRSHFQGCLDDVRVYSRAWDSVDVSTYYNSVMSSTCVNNPLDGDSDCVEDAGDNCPFVPNSDQSDIDSDNFGDACDNCISIPNVNQFDCDSDGRGDACSTMDVLAVQDTHSMALTTAVSADVLIRNGSTLVHRTCALDGTCRVSAFEEPTGLVSTLAIVETTGLPLEVAVSEDGSLLVTTVQNGTSVDVVATRTDNDTTWQLVFPGELSNIRDLQISGDGRVVVFTAVNTSVSPTVHSIYVMNVAVGSVQQLFSTYPNCDCGDLSISFDGETVAFETCASNIVPVASLQTSTVIVATAVSSAVSLQDVCGELHLDSSCVSPRLSRDGSLLTYIIGDGSLLQAGTLALYSLTQRELLYMSPADDDHLYLSPVFDANMAYVGVVVIDVAVPDVHKLALFDIGGNRMSVLGSSVTELCLSGRHASVAVSSGVGKLFLECEDEGLRSFVRIVDISNYIHGTSAVGCPPQPVSYEESNCRVQLLDYSLFGNLVSVGDGEYAVCTLSSAN